MQKLTPHHRDILYKIIALQLKMRCHCHLLHWHHQIINKGMEQKELSHY